MSNPKSNRNQKCSPKTSEMLGSPKVIFINCFLRTSEYYNVVSFLAVPLGEPQSAVHFFPAGDLRRTNDFKWWRMLVVVDY